MPQLLKKATSPAQLMLLIKGDVHQLLFYTIEFQEEITLRDVGKVALVYIKVFRQHLFRCMHNPVADQEGAVLG